MTNLKYIFVHGLSGWGSYDDAYRRMPYWGMRGGDLMQFLREKGFDCYMDKFIQCLPAEKAAVEGLKV